MKKLTNICLACFNLEMGQKQGKTYHNYGANCRLKVEKTVLPDENLKFNDWSKHINKEVVKNLNYK